MKVKKQKSLNENHIQKQFSFSLSLKFEAFGEPAVPETLVKGLYLALTHQDMFTVQN